MGGGATAVRDEAYGGGQSDDASHDGLLIRGDDTGPFPGVFFFSSRRRHTRLPGDWSSDVCSSDLGRSDLVLDSVEAGHQTSGEREVRVGSGVRRSEERRVGKSVDLGGRRIIKK